MPISELSERGLIAEKSHIADDSRSIVNCSLQRVLYNSCNTFSFIYLFSFSLRFLQFGGDICHVDRVRFLRRVLRRYG